MSINQKATLEAEKDLAAAFSEGLYCTAQQADKFFTECVAYHLGRIYRHKRSGLTRPQYWVNRLIGASKL